MTRPTQVKREPVHALRELALSYPEAQEGIACEGTSLEKRTIKARNKAFLFLGVSDVMVKLHDSLPEATNLAAKAPGRCKVGAHGWVTVTFSNEPLVSLDLLQRWIDESYRLLAPKQLVAQLEGGPGANDTAKKKTAKKRARSR